MIEIKPRFKVGRILATPGALAALEKAGQGVWDVLARHVRADWGTVDAEDAEDAEANNQALKDGSRLLSAYVLKTGEKLWVITEAEDDHGNRAATTLCLPSEY
jgi:hypothetical protein